MSVPPTGRSSYEQANEMLVHSLRGESVGPIDPEASSYELANEILVRSTRGESTELYYNELQRRSLLTASTPHGVGDQLSCLEIPKNDAVEIGFFEFFISPIILFFRSIYETAWDWATKVVNLFWGMKMDMDMTEVEKRALDENLVIPVPVVVAGQAPVVIPNVIYDDKQWDKIAKALYLAKEEAESRHPTENKLLSLRLDFYKALHPNTQNKLTQLIHNRINNPVLNSLKDYLLNQDFWNLFSNTVEHLYLEFSLQQLGSLYRVINEKPVPFKKQEFQDDFLKLPSIDCHAIGKLIMSEHPGWAFKRSFDAADKKQALALLDRRIATQQITFDQIREILN